MGARHHILALLVALLWLVGCTPMEPILDAEERVSQGGDIDALPARRAEQPQILCPSKGADTNGNLPHALEIPSASVQAIDQGVVSNRLWRPVKWLSSGTARGPPSWG